MMNFLSVRCLNCNNIDEFPRMDYDEIPYCSQCAATSNLVPATPPTKAQVQPQQWSGGDELANLFSKNLSLLDQPVTPPMSPPSNINFSISQHYTHPTSFRPPTPQQHQAQLDSQIMSEASSSSAMTVADQEKTYIQYLLHSNLGSETSQNDLEIALAHGIIDHSEYTRAIGVHNQLLQQRSHEALMIQQREQQEAENMMVQSQLFAEMQAREMGRGLDEDCSAHSMLSASAASRQKSDPVFRTAEFFNDYYGGVDASYEDDDETAPCSVYTAGAGCRLRPFDL